MSRLGIFVVKVRENLFISSSALPGSGRESGTNNNKLTDFNYDNPKPDYSVCDCIRFTGEKSLAFLLYSFVILKLRLYRVVQAVVE